MEVNGGAELLCRQIAEHLVEYYDIDVVTTKAIDYMSWKDEYTDDNEIINGVNVIRFNVTKERNMDSFNLINGQFLAGNFTSIEEEHKWIDEQGPYAPKIIDYIKDNQEKYDAFLFFTYLYYPTVRGVKEVSDKAIVFSFAHDEPYIYMNVFNDVFEKARAFYFCTNEERQFIRNKYHNYDIPYIIGGAGVDVPKVVSGDNFKQKYGLDNYIIYVGRIDDGKNCKELFDHFFKYKKRNNSNLKLVLLGKAVIPVPESEDIVSLGFVPEQDKFDGIAGSKCLILPSHFESLSIVILEAFELKIPIIVDGHCEVTKGHCIKSNGGFYYMNYYEFEEELKMLTTDSALNKKMGECGNKYVSENYKWDIIISKLRGLIDRITGENG